MVASPTGAVSQIIRHRQCAFHEHVLLSDARREKLIRDILHDFMEYGGYMLKSPLWGEYATCVLVDGVLHGQANLIKVLD